MIWTTKKRREGEKERRRERRTKKSSEKRETKEILSKVSLVLSKEEHKESVIYETDLIKMCSTTRYIRMFVSCKS